MYWDDIDMFSYSNEYRLRIRKINNGDLIEIDSLEELASVDSSYAQMMNEKNGIRHIDFLKIDVEGQELDVLKGLSDMIHYERIDMIQFELNEYGINKGVTLSDFKDFSGEGYIVGKIYPFGVDFELKDSFNFWKTSPNYVAVLKKCEKTIESIGVKE